jgi:hypothetical protein
MNISHNKKKEKVIDELMFFNTNHKKIEYKLLIGMKDKE